MSKDKQQDDKQQASLALMQWASAQRDRRAFLQLSAAGASIASLSTTAAFAQAATQGVTKDQIVLGHIGDLSGPLVSLSKPSVNGMRMRVKEINDQGGINGRKIKLNVEDSGYDPKKGVLAAQKLLSQDKVFAMIGTLGTVISLPTIQLCVQRGVPHLFPITAHHGNYEPFHKLKFASFPPYPETTAAGLKEILLQKGAKRIGILYQDDEFGLEILRGTEMALKAMPGTELVEKTSYKRGATDFSSQMQKLLAAKVDFIVLGTIIRETIGAIATGRKMGYAGDFFGSSAAYMPAVAKAGGKVVEGFYAMSEAPT
ncbi:MAG: ABC transporter substrate-binding protein, partial [Betaproteobacteria bacterium]